MRAGPVLVLGGDMLVSLTAVEGDLVTPMRTRP